MTNQENRALGLSQDHCYRLIACVAYTHTLAHSKHKRKRERVEKKSQCLGLDPAMPLAEKDADLIAVMDPPLPACSTP